MSNIDLNDHILIADIGGKTRKQTSSVIYNSQKTVNASVIKTTMPAKMNSFDDETLTMGTNFCDEYFTDLSSTISLTQLLTKPFTSNVLPSMLLASSAQMSPTKLSPTESEELQPSKFTKMYRKVAKHSQTIPANGSPKPLTIKVKSRQFLAKQTMHFVGTKIPKRMLVAIAFICFSFASHKCTAEEMTAENFVSMANAMHTKTTEQLNDEPIFDTIFAETGADGFDTQFAFDASTLQSQTSTQSIHFVQLLNFYLSPANFYVFYTQKPQITTRLF